MATKSPESWIPDVVAIGGLTLLSAGLWAEFGWPWAAVSAGVILLLVGLYGAAR